MRAARGSIPPAWPCEGPCGRHNAQIAPGGEPLHVDALATASPPRSPLARRHRHGAVAHGRGSTASTICCGGAQQPSSNSTRQYPFVTSSNRRTAVRVRQRDRPAYLMIVASQGYTTRWECPSRQRPRDGDTRRHRHESHGHGEAVARMAHCVRSQRCGSIAHRVALTSSTCRHFAEIKVCTIRQRGRQIYAVLDGWLCDISRWQQLRLSTSSRFCPRRSEVGVPVRIANGARDAVWVQ